MATGASTGCSVAACAAAGEQLEVKAGSLFQNRDYAVLNEDRSMLSGLFGRLYGISGAKLQQVFAGVRPIDLGLV